MIGDVVAMQTIRARLKIGRRVNVTNSQCSQIRHDLACLGKSELAIELQAVGADWNTRPLLFGHIMSSRVETPISNDEIRMTKSETVPDLSRSFRPSAFELLHLIHIFSGTCIPRSPKPCFKTRAVRSHKARRELRVGSSDFSTGQGS